MTKQMTAPMPDAKPEPSAPARHGNVDRLLNGPIGGTLFRLSAPNTVGFLVASVVTVTEMWFVGQLGTTALAGLALGFPMFMLMMMLSAGSMGGAIAAIVARAVGGGDQEAAEALAWHALAIALLASILFAFAFLFLGEGLFILLGGRGDVLVATLAYAEVAFYGGVAVWMANTFSSLLRGAGDMKTPARAMLLAAAIQIPVGGALTLGWGPVPGLGIVGVAWGAVVAFAISGLYQAMRLVSGRSGLHLHLNALRFRPALFQQILRLGMVASVSPVLTISTVVILTGLVSTFGEEALAGFGIATRLEFILVPIVFGIGAAMISMVGANIGAGQVARAERIGWTGGLSAALIAGAIGSLTAIWPEAWSGLFTTDSQVMMTAGLYLIIVGPFYAFHGLGLSLYFASQGAGAVHWPVLATIVRLFVTAGGGMIAVKYFDIGLAELPWFVVAGMVVYGGGTAMSVYLGAWRKVR